ncbi:MAG: AbrB/MazE/SpoVT family DNA-binding domain-containing protein [Gammaproteobacteria bacterium]
MHTPSVSTKGQVVIPRALRERLGLRPGVRVRFEEENGGLRMTTVRDQTGKDASIAAGRGLAGYKGPRISEADIRKAVRQRARQRAKR